MDTIAQLRCDFYTYILYRTPSPETPRRIIDPSTGMIPFYVGKGCGRRMDMHWDCVRRHDACKHMTCRVIRKEQRQGGKTLGIKIAEGITEQAAFDLEKLFVSLGAVYGWPLVNRTFGGEGTSGLKVTRTPEQREQNRLRTLARFSDPDERERNSSYLAAYWETPEAREKQRQQALRRFADPEERARHGQRMQEVFADREMTDEERERSRQAALQQWSDPEFREKRSQQNLERYSDPHERGLSRQRTEALWQDPDFRKRQKEGCENPLSRQKISDARKGKALRVQTYEGFIDPLGNAHPPITNLAAFCRDHGLSYCGMWLVAQGKQHEHKGWTRQNPDNDQPTLL